jgi:hypothetical protein
MKRYESEDSLGEYWNTTLDGFVKLMIIPFAIIFFGITFPFWCIGKLLEKEK